MTDVEGDAEHVEHWTLRRNSCVQDLYDAIGKIACVDDLHVVRDGMGAKGWLSGKPFTFPSVYKSCSHTIKTVEFFFTGDVYVYLGVYKANQAKRAYLLGVWVHELLRGKQLYRPVLKAASDYLREKRMEADVPMQPCIHRIATMDRYRQAYIDFGWRLAGSGDQMTVRFDPAEQSAEDAAEDAADAVADAEDEDEGEAEVGATRKRAAENADPNSNCKASRHKRAREQKAAAAAAAQKAAAGGYSLVPRGQLRKQGIVFATGNERTCLPDAMSVIECTLLGIGRTSSSGKQAVDWFADCVKADPRRADGSEPTEADAMVYANGKKFNLVHVPEASPRILLGFHDTLYLVRLLIYYMHEGVEKVDKHFVVYDSVKALIIDNMRGMDGIKIDDRDRIDNRTAIKPFHEKLFPLATKVHLASVCRAFL